MPSKAQAQYRSPYIYTNNAYLNYALASSRAKRARAAAARKSKATRKRTAAKRKAKRVSTVDFKDERMNRQKLTARNVEVA